MAQVDMAESVVTGGGRGSGGRAGAGDPGGVAGPAAPEDGSADGGSGPEQDAERSWVLDVLEDDQLVAAKQKPFGRRRLGRGTRVLMWVLRVYVVTMLAIVLWQVLTAIRPGT